MERYISVDSGKYATKIAVYNEKDETVSFGKFSTKISPGDFREDMLESGTMIAEVGGKVYKVGRGASTGADLETSKASEAHRACTLIAIAMNCSENEVDKVHAAVGIPISEWENINRRVAYKEYILPEGEITVRLMSKNGAEPAVKKFEIVSRYAFPETMGALFLPEVYPATDDEVGIIDIGNLNVNGAIWSHRDIDHGMCFTNELGGNSMISGLAQDLSAAFSRCDANYVAKLLKRFSGDERCLSPVSGSAEKKKEVQEQSRTIIHDYLLAHVKKIKAACNTKRWPLDYMQLVFIGGTAELLHDEIIEVFGSEVVIPPKAEYANAEGSLAVLVAKEIGKVIKLEK